MDYIDAQFEAYLQEELKIKRSLFSYHDTRIHVCLYFISPTGHSLKPLDLLTMKSLDSKVRLWNSSKNLPYFLKHLVAFRSSTTFQFYIRVFGLGCILVSVYLRFRIDLFPKYVGVRHLFI